MAESVHRAEFMSALRFSGGAFGITGSATEGERMT